MVTCAEIDNDYYKKDLNIVKVGAITGFAASVVGMVMLIVLTFLLMGGVITLPSMAISEIMLNVLLPFGSSFLVAVGGAVVGMAGQKMFTKARGEREKDVAEFTIENGRITEEKAKFIVKNFDKLDKNKLQKEITAIKDIDINFTNKTLIKTLKEKLALLDKTISMEPSAATQQGTDSMKIGDGKPGFTVAK